MSNGNVYRMQKYLKCAHNSSEHIGSSEILKIYQIEQLIIIVRTFDTYSILFVQIPNMYL